MCEHEPEQVTYVEGALTFVLDDAGHVEYGLRLDARSGLKSLDEQVEPPPTPPGGWADGTIMVDGRPVMPMHHATAQRRRAAVTPSSGRAPVATRMPRRGPSRERRPRPTRRRTAAARGGDPDSAEGDGEGPPSPAEPDLANVAQRASSNSPATDTACPRWSVGATGFDSVALTWRDGAAAGQLREIARAGRVDALTGRHQGATWKGSHMLLALPRHAVVLGGPRRWRCSGPQDLHSRRDDRRAGLHRWIVRTAGWGQRGGQHGSRIWPNLTDRVDRARSGFRNQSNLSEPPD